MQSYAELGLAFTLTPSRQTLGLQIRSRENRLNCLGVTYKSQAYVSFREYSGSGIEEMSKFMNAMSMEMVGGEGVGWLINLA